MALLHRQLRILDHHLADVKSDIRDMIAVGEPNLARADA
jgi:hypothetical protein